MRTTCPNGHVSRAADYCDECGVAIESPPVEEAAETSACPNCGSPLGSGIPCADCGFVLGAVDTVALWMSQQWEVVVRPDRTYFDMLEPDGMEFPSDAYAGRIALTGDHVSIGRHSKSKGIDAGHRSFGRPGGHRSLASTRGAHAPAVRELGPGRPGLHQRDVPQCRRGPAPTQPSGRAVPRRSGPRRCVDDAHARTPGALGHGACRPGQPAVDRHAQHRPRPKRGGDRPARPTALARQGGRGC